MSAEEHPQPGPEPEPTQPPEPTTEEEEEDSQPDLLVWGMLALVILGGLTWLILARRPTSVPPVALPGGSLTQRAGSRPPSSPAAPVTASPARPQASPSSPQASPRRPGPSPGQASPPARPSATPSPQGAARPGAPDPATSPPGPPPVAAVPPDGTGAPIMYVGAEPTGDPRSWAYVHGDILLGALREVDSNPSTALTPQQLKALSDLLTEVQDASEELGPASVDFVNMVQGVLEPRQMAGMTAAEESLCAVTPDADLLIARLKKLAASAPARTPPPPQATQAVYPANFLVSGLVFLETFQRAPLTAEQAARLLPSLQTYAARLKDLTAYYQRIPRILTPRQGKAFQEALADMRVAQNPPLEERHLTLAEMQLYLAERLER